MISVLLLLVVPFVVGGVLIELLIRVHYPICNNKYGEYDIGNLFYIWVLDEFRILLFAPLYMLLYALKYYYFAKHDEEVDDKVKKRKETEKEKGRVRFLLWHYLTINYYEEELHGFLYKKPWSKKTIAPLSERQIRQERLLLLRQEYQSLWVLVKPRDARHYYFSKADPSVRKWKIPEMTYEEEQVRAFFSQREYKAVMKEIGGLAKWKKLNWKKRLQLLEKKKKKQDQVELTKMKQRKKEKKELRLIRIGAIKPPPKPPSERSTKVTPFGVGVSEGAVDVIKDHTNLFAKNLKKMRRKKEREAKRKRKLLAKEKKALKRKAKEEKRAAKIQQMKDAGEYEDY